MSERSWGFRTRAVHAGAAPDPTTGARAVPIYQTTSFVFEDADRRRQPVRASRSSGNIYSRIANPTVAAFEERMASLEGGLGAVATSQRAGRRVPHVRLPRRRGRPHRRHRRALRRHAHAARRHAAPLRRGHRRSCGRRRPTTSPRRSRPARKLVYTEVIANPSGAVADLAGLAEVAHAAGVPLIVDATMATPYLCRPIEHGADIVVHSATKFLGGHGTTLGGVVVESGRFDWGNGRFPQMTEPVPSYGGLTWWGNFHRVRLPHQAARRAAARHRRHAVPAQRVPAAPGRGDAAAADGGARGERPGRRRVAGRRPARVATCRWAGLPDHPDHDRAPALPPARARARSSRSAWRAAGPRGERFIESRAAVQPPGQHRRRPHARHAPRLDHAPPARRRAARRRGRAGGPRAHLGRARRSRRHPAGTSTRPSPRPRRRLVTLRAVGQNPTAGERQRILRETRTVAMVGASPNPARASNFVATYLLSSTRLRGVVRQPERHRDPRAAGVPVARRPARACPTSSTCSAARRTCPPCSTTCSRWTACARSGSSSASTTRTLAQRAEAAGLQVVMDRCLKVEHARFHGGLHLAGFDTGVITLPAAAPERGAGCGARPRVWRPSRRPAAGGY